MEPFYSKGHSSSRKTSVSRKHSAPRYSLGIYVVAGGIPLSFLGLAKSSDQCLHQLRLPSLRLQCKYLSVNLLYDIIKDKITVKLSEFCSFEFSCSKQHSLSIFPLHSQSTHHNCNAFFFGNIATFI